MASLKDLPFEARLNNRLKLTDFGVVHSIETVFANKPFESGFKLSRHTRAKVEGISKGLHLLFDDEEGQYDQLTDLEPFFFACAATSLIESRPRIALSNNGYTGPTQPVELGKFKDVIEGYLDKNPYLDGLIDSYRDILVPFGSSSEVADLKKMDHARLFSGMTFFLLECENLAEYVKRREALATSASLPK